MLAFEGASTQHAICVLRAENVMLLSFYAGSTGEKFLLAGRELRELEGLWPQVSFNRCAS